MMQEQCKPAIKTWFNTKWQSPIDKINPNDKCQFERQVFIGF
jgi:hypothetical protein